MDGQIEELQRYVAWAGGSKRASDRIGVSYDALRHYVKGRRRIPAEIALEIERDSRGLFKKERLIWGDLA